MKELFNSLQANTISDECIERLKCIMGFINEEQLGEEDRYYFEEIFKMMER